MVATIPYQVNSSDYVGVKLGDPNIQPDAEGKPAEVRMMRNICWKDIAYVLSIADPDKIIDEKVLLIDWLSRMTNVNVKGLDKRMEGKKKINKEQADYIYSLTALVSSAGDLERLKKHIKGRHPDFDLEAALEIINDGLDEFFEENNDYKEKVREAKKQAKSGNPDGKDTTTTTNNKRSSTTRTRGASSKRRKVVKVSPAKTNGDVDDIDDDSKNVGVSGVVIDGKFIPMKTDLKPAPTTTTDPQLSFANGTAGQMVNGQFVPAPPQFSAPQFSAAPYGSAPMTPPAPPQRGIGGPSHGHTYGHHHPYSFYPGPYY